MSNNEALIDFCNALEAACVNLRMKLGDKPLATTDKERQWSWDPSRVHWDTKDGTKGPYEKCKEDNNLDYQNMVLDLKRHQGKLNRDNTFYWLFDDDSVGRKGAAK